MRKAIYITPSNQDFYELILEDAAAGETNWTISRHARRGDLILLYVCAPISSIVAVATVATDPVQDFDPRSAWIRHWLADMNELRMLKEPIPRTMLLERFPSWGYWKQPRNSVKVPDLYRDDLARIVEVQHRR